ncbi:hypothetical protein K8I28_03105 [bacterium]|nr:hypothetical protein [bacterium]
MSSNEKMRDYQMPSMDEIETDLENWERRLASWAKRIPWASPEEREPAMSTARFIRKLVAEAWIHALACKARGGDPMAPPAFRARRLHRQLMKFGPGLAMKMEERLPEAVPNIAA